MKSTVFEKSKEKKISSGKEPIAIVGIGCRFPGDINGPYEFWNALTNGVDAITDVPKDRWDVDAFYDPNPDKAGKIKSRKGGFLKDIDKFDADFFGIFPAEANRIDPQQRFLLEVTYETLEDAGIKLENFSGTKTAVFMGVFMNDYWDVQTSSLQREQISPHVPMGVSLTSIANRLSYVYNLKGPSVTLDTACSSSLVGVHLACRSIWSGESELALAGGVNIILRPESSIMMSKGNFLSPDGYCKTFDSRANGYVRSEGCGMVLLKPLSQAEADGDHIYATILGSAVNQDGHTEEGFTVPSLDSQMDMLKTAYEDAGINPAEVSYVEAHGTGTPVGDPIETNAFGNVIGLNRKKGDECLIGSVKTNIGHLEAAAGIAGLIKLTMVLKNGQAPMNLHFVNPNPKIPFDKYKLKVPTKTESLKKYSKQLIGGVNSFGAGGTNAHIVLQNYLQPNSSKKETYPKKIKTQLFILSGKSLSALKDNVKIYVDYLSDTEHDLREICGSAASRRSAMDHRLSIAADSKEALTDSLNAFLNDETRTGMTYQKPSKTFVPKMGFIFSGQGPQWYAMGQQLLKSSPLFRDIVLKIDKLFSKVADWSLLDEMNKDEANSRVSETRIAQPAIMAIQIGLTELWKSWGVIPEGCVGHSIGEVAAAYAAGALSLEQAVEVIYHRSRGQHKATDKGKMLAVGLPVEEVRPLFKEYEQVVSIAAINGPNLLTLSGDAEPLEHIAEELDRKDIFHRFLKVNVPFHSHHMEPLKQELIASLSHLKPARAKKALYSTVTGNKEDGSHLVSDYWYKNVREPVYFTNALQSMIDDGYNTFVEIAPHPVLAAGANELLQVNNIKNAIIVPSLRRKEDEEMIMVGSLGQLFAHGVELDLNHFFGNDKKYVKLPRYVWQHESYWFENEENKKMRVGSKIHPHLKGFNQSISNPDNFLWDIELDQNVHKYIENHKVDAAIIFPGTGHLELAYAVAKESFPNEFEFLEDIHFESALFLPDEGESPHVTLEISSNEGDYVIYSSPKNEGDFQWTKHSKGKINYLGDSFISRPVDLNEIKERVINKVSITDFYLQLKESGLQYGEAFRNIQKLWKSENAVLAAIKLSKSLSYEADNFNIHPALLDACLHTIFAAKPEVESEKSGIYLPIYIRRFKIHEKPGAEVWNYLEITESNENFLGGNYFIMDKNGKLIAEIQGFRCKYIEGSRGEGKNDTYDGMYEYHWEETDISIYEDTGGKQKNETLILFNDQKNIVGSFGNDFERDHFNVIKIDKGDAFRIYSENHFEINPENQLDTERILKTLTDQKVNITKIIYGWILDQKRDVHLSVSELQEQQGALSQELLNMLRAVVSQGLEPSIAVITQGVELLGDKDKININQSAAYGISRVTINEYPFIKMGTIDIGDKLSDDDRNHLYQCLAADLPKKKHLVELAIRNDKVLTRRLQTVEEEIAEDMAAKKLPSLGSSYRADVREYGIMDSIVFRETRRKQPENDEIEIQVHAAGLNFKDIMNVMGLLSDEAVEGGIAGKNLGLECSGKVTAVGKDVTEFKVGDEVMAWSSNSYSGYSIAKSNCVISKPDNLSFEEASSLTVVFLTAYYSLNYLGRINENERILIHAASGGVGLAAIQIAQLAGAEIIATAGNEEKRKYLKSLGIQHVFDSRSLGFTDEVMKITEGKGVDIVLNSLSGKGITQSIKCLAPFGRFIEIGKADIYNDAKLALRRFGDNLSYHAVDLDRLMLQKPILGKKMFKDLGELFSSNKLKALPNKIFHITELSDALKYMSKGTHIGKITVKMDQEPITMLPSNTLELDPEATYLITGGASGFGLSLAKLLVDKGAKHLALVSRSGCKSEADWEIVRSLENKGVQVHLMKSDITSTKDIRLLMNIIRDTMPPLRGVIHSAAVLEDATIPNVDNERFMRVFRPKVLGAWNLHQATQKETLDFFLMLSSISSIFGLPGQSNYSAANNFLDRLAHYRQSIGLRASSVNLGVLGMYAGMSKEGGNVINVLANQGWLPLSLQQVTSKIENVLLQQPAQRMAANLDWKRFRDFFAHLIDDSRFAHLIEAAQQKGKVGSGSTTLLDEILNASVEERQGKLQEKLTNSLAKILGTSSDKIETDISISVIGLDSLMLNQLRNWIQQKLEINYPLMKIAKGPSIEELSAQLLEELNQEEEVSTNEDTSGIDNGENVEIVNDWLVRNKGNRQTIKKRVFCIHPVGAGASMFSHFIYNPPKDTDIMAFQLPGRENRKDEKPYEDIQKLIPDMAEAVLPLLDVPFIILGHSFGGIIGFELVRYLREHYNISPAQLFITGTIAPQLTKGWKKRDVINETSIESNSEEKLLSLMNYIDDVEFIKRILPVMRKDMPIIMTYPYTPLEPLDIPITAFAADKDEVVLINEVACWKEQTKSNFTLEVVEGDHWFLSRNKKLILQRLTEAVEKASTQKDIQAV
ncbi:SDR family NAD(P)-dependent oxidoreductase [Fulvivirgaceae bacterium BMA10]|uniref:SDR family NAD(P)-dependent oxidoreductase n=1 Tax=Splendidivirga corallicola TaxID=3051826 RepID=A0ABT8KTY9_9BACT|nr:SDR family NAD(P)-dependent oxidoreductase [Fulvivirgaceae bacterium BMA10]